jgi:hypothetical protein
MFRSVSKLSQAAAHPRRGTIIPVMDFFPARNGDMLHNKSRKSKGEKRFISKIYMQDTLQAQSAKNREGHEGPSQQAGEK